MGRDLLFLLLSGWPLGIVVRTATLARGEPGLAGGVNTLSSKKNALSPLNRFAEHSPSIISCLTVSSAVAFPLDRSLRFSLSLSVPIISAGFSG